MSPFEENLAKLSVAAKKLNTKTEDLNKLLGNLETKLAESQLGLAVWLNVLIAKGAEREAIDQNGEPIGNRHECDGWFLGYDKVAEAWHIAVKRVQIRFDPMTSSAYRDEEHLDLDDVMPLLNSPRGVRVQAAEHLEALVVALAARAEHFAQEVESAEKAFAKDSPEPTELERRTWVALKGHAEETGENFLGVQAAQDAARGEFLTIPHKAVTELENAANAAAKKGKKK